MTKEKKRSNFKCEEKERTWWGGGIELIALVTLLVFMLTMLVYVGDEGKGLFRDLMFSKSSSRYKY